MRCTPVTTGAARYAIGEPPDTDLAFAGCLKPDVQPVADIDAGGHGIGS